MAFLIFPPLPRLIAQMLFSILAWHLNIRVDYLPMPFLGTLRFRNSEFTDYCGVDCWTNECHQLDGWLDGLAAGGCAIAAALFVIGWQSGQLLPTCCDRCSGFYPWVSALQSAPGPTLYGRWRCIFFGV